MQSRQSVRILLFPRRFLLFLVRILNPNFLKKGLFPLCFSFHKSDVKAVWPSGYGVRLRI